MNYEVPTEKAPAGTPVFFFEFGDEGSTPLPGFVISMADSLICRMLIVSPDGLTNTKFSVHPLGHPGLKDDRGRPTPSAMKNGAWSYHPWFLPPKEEPAVEPEADKPTPEDPGVPEDKVLELYEEHGDIGKVHNRLRSKGVTKSQIEEILNRRG